MDFKGLLFSALSVAVITAVIATVFTGKPREPEILIPSLNLTAPALGSPLAGEVLNANGITLNKYSFDQSNIGAIIKRDQHNIVNCSMGVALNTPLIANGTTAITPASRYWGYEYTGQEIANYRAGKKQLELYNGTFFLSNGELAAPTDAATRDLYLQINKLTSYNTQSRSKMYYFMSQNDLCFSCSKGLQNPTACPGYPGYSSSSSAISCTNASQCPSGRGCVNGTCGICQNSSQCPAGQICSNGVCRPCTSNSECASGQACVNGTCGPCTSTSQCEGRLCMPGGVCTPCSGSNSSLACPQGQVCTSNGTCSSASSSSSAIACTNASQCPHPLGCVNGTCGPCQNSSQCASGEICVNDACIPASSSSSSSSSSACTNGTICPNNQVCVGGTCTPCNPPSVICPGGRVCTSGTCFPCDTTNHQCPPGNICQSNGACVPSSSSSSSSSVPPSSSSSSSSRTSSSSSSVSPPSSSSSSSSQPPSSSSSSSSSVQCDSSHPCPSGQTCVGNVCQPIASSSSSSTACQNIPPSCDPAAIAPNCLAANYSYTTCSCYCTAYAASSSSSKLFVPNTCGNGVLEARYNTNPYNYYTTPVDEECDDGNNDDDDGCYATCATMIPPALLGTKAQVSCGRSPQWSNESVWFDRIDPKLPTSETAQGSIPWDQRNNMGLAGQALTFASPHPDDGGREKIWLFGSSSGTNLFLNQSYAYATGIYSTTDGFHWELRGELPVATRTDRGDLGISIVKYQNPIQNATELWLFGGKTYDRTKPVTGYTGYGETYTDKVFTSQDGIHWSAAPPLPYKVLNPHAAILNGKIYVIADSIISKLPWDNLVPNSAEPKNSRMVFSFNGSQWRVEPELLPVPLNSQGLLGLAQIRLTEGPFTSPGKVNTDYGLVNFSFIEFKGALYLVGGNSASGWFGRNMHDVWKFDGSHWSHVSSLPNRFIDGSAVVYQNRLWVLGGGILAQGGYSSCDIFSSPNGVDWTWETNFLPTSRVNASALTYKLGASDALWMLGGQGSDRRVQVMQTNYTSTATGAIKTVPYCLGVYDYAEPRCDIGSLTCPAGYSPSCYSRPNEQGYYGDGTATPTYSQADGQYHDLASATKICALYSPVLANQDSSLLCTPSSDIVSSPLFYQIDSNDYYSQTQNIPSSMPNINRLNRVTCNNCPDFSNSPSPVCIKNDDPSLTAAMTCSNISSTSSSSSSQAVSTLSGNLLWAEQQGKINTIRLDGTGKKPFYVAPTYKNPSTQVTFYYTINSIVVDHDNRKVYWSMQNPDMVINSTSGDYQIVAADINSNGVASNLTVLQRANNFIYTGLALDGNGGLYFAQMPASGYSSTSRIRKWNLTTQQLTEIFTISSTTAVPSALAIDTQNSLLVWTKQRELYASDLAGAGAHKIAQSANNIQNLLALDRFNQRIFWYDIPTGTNTGTFHSTTYDGTVTTDLLSCVKGSAGITFYPSTGTFVWLSPYDGNTATPGKIVATGPDGVTNPVAIVTTGTAPVTATSLALDIDTPTSAIPSSITSPICVSAP